MRYEIRVAGFGGQGVITLGYVLAKAAGIHDGKYALMTQSYGPEARGGACRADVIISDDPIDYPKLSHPDCFLAMSMDAYNQFHESIRGGGKMILDEGLVNVEPIGCLEGGKIFRVASMKEAEALGNKLTANMVMLGYVQSVTGVVSEQALEEAVRERFPRFTEINLEAIRRGMELGRLATG